MCTGLIPAEFNQLHCQAQVSEIKLIEPLRDWLKSKVCRPFYFSMAAGPWAVIAATQYQYQRFPDSVTNWINGHWERCQVKFNFERYVAEELEKQQDILHKETFLIILHICRKSVQKWRERERETVHLSISYPFISPFLKGKVFTAISHQ